MNNYGIIYNNFDACDSKNLKYLCIFYMFYAITIMLSVDSTNWN